jgi:hypothetical protein
MIHRAGILVIAAALLVAAAVSLAPAQTGEPPTSVLLPAPEQMPAFGGISWRAMRYDLPVDECDESTGAVTSGMYYWAAQTFTDLLQYERAQLAELEARGDAAAIRAARERIAELESLPPEDLRFRSMVWSAAVEAIVTLTYHSDPDAFFDNLKQNSPVFAGAGSMGVGARSLLAAGADSYNGYFRRGNVVAGVYVSRGRDTSVEADPVVCGSAIARGLDGILSGAGGDFTPGEPDVGRDETAGGATPVEPAVEPGREEDRTAAAGRRWTYPSGADWRIDENPAIAEAVICERVSNGAPEGITRLFKKETREVTLVMRSKPGSGDITVWVDWYHLGAQAHRDIVTAPPDSVFYVSILPGRGDYLQPGQYRAEISADGRNMGKLSFEVLRE